MYTSSVNVRLDLSAAPQDLDDFETVSDFEILSEFNNHKDHNQEKPPKLKQR